MSDSVLYGEAEADIDKCLFSQFMPGIVSYS